MGPGTPRKRKDPPKCQFCLWALAPAVCMAAGRNSNSLRQRVEQFLWGCGLWEPASLSLCGTSGGSVLIMFMWPAVLAPAWRVSLASCPAELSAVGRSLGPDGLGCGGCWGRVLQAAVWVCSVARHQLASVWTVGFGPRPLPGGRLESHDSGLPGQAVRPSRCPPPAQRGWLGPCGPWFRDEGTGGPGVTQRVGAVVGPGSLQVSLGCE